MDCFLNTDPILSTIKLHTYAGTNINELQDIYDILPSLKFSRNWHSQYPQNIKYAGAYRYMPSFDYMKNVLDSKSCTPELEKNFFAVVDGKIVLHSNNLNKIMNKKMTLRGNKVTSIAFHQSIIKYSMVKQTCGFNPIEFTKIYKYMSKGINVKYELDYVNCFDDGKFYPFLVYRNSQFAFLGKKFLVSNFETSHINGNIFLRVSESNRLHFEVVNVYNINNDLFNNNIEIQTCSCSLFHYFKIEHQHVMGNVTSRPRNKQINIILINYKDLDTYTQNEYDRMFTSDYSPKMVKMGKLFADKLN